MKLFIFAVLLAVSVDALNKASDCKCKSQAKGRLIGGGGVTVALHPWYANITTELASFDPAVTCGAVILNEKTVLTAG